MSIGEKKRLITEFLQKCNEYADRKLAEYEHEAKSLTGLEALGTHDKIHHWTIYKTFNEVAIDELGGSELDDWFE